jgi:hypothetical protein
MSLVFRVFFSMNVAYLVSDYEIHCNISATGANLNSVVEFLGGICIFLFKNAF